MARKWEFLENFLLSENKAIAQCTNLRGTESDSGIEISIKSCFEGVIDCRMLAHLSTVYRAYTSKRFPQLLTLKDSTQIILKIRHFYSWEK